LHPSRAAIKLLRPLHYYAGSLLKVQQLIRLPMMLGCLWDRRFVSLDLWLVNEASRKIQIVLFILVVEAVSRSDEVTMCLHHG
jgi:hypothetical protein